MHHKYLGGGEVDSQQDHGRRDIDDIEWTVPIVSIVVIVVHFLFSHLYISIL